MRLSSRSPPLDTRVRGTAVRNALFLSTPLVLYISVVIVATPVEVREDFTTAYKGRGHPWICGSTRRMFPVCIVARGQRWSASSNPEYHYGLGPNEQGRIRLIPYKPPQGR